jgi:lysyl-tRNA synthetase class 2
MNNEKRSEQELVRFQKLSELREKGFSYPNDSKPDITAKDFVNLEVKAPEDSKRYTLAGRLMQIRVMGKAAFAHIEDHTQRLQLYVSKDGIGEEAYADFKKLDLGDIVETKGYLFVTKTGEKSLHSESLRLLSKSLIPLPEKWHGLTDVEARYRYRYVDLMTNPEVRDIFKKKAQIISEIRSFLNENDFLEVETPVLCEVAGGATARPFKTHFNALSSDMTLRIALELPLKKLIVGGLNRVYEIGRVFRNEGLSKKHNPEFTMLEFYQAYADFNDLMDLTEKLFVRIANKVNGSLKIKYGADEIDLTTPWPRISMKDSIYEIGEVSKEYNLDNLGDVQKVADKYKIKLEEPNDWGKSIEALWGDLVEPKIKNPVFITEHPFSISPLARKSDRDPKITDRFELIIAGMEMANAFSELNDPIDQRERFVAQAERKASGDLEAHPIDEDFLRALEYAMPPTGGEGIGIDRLTMLLTNSPTIREVLLFPQLKSLSNEPSNEETTE